MAPLLLLLLFVFSPPSSTLTSAYKILRYDNPTTATKSTVTGAGNGNAAAVFNASKKYEGSSELVHMRYHMGPVLTSEIRLYIIWYGDWPASQKSTIKDFLHSISNSPPAAASRPSVTQWWNTVQLYTDQTGANVSRSVILVAEHNDPYSHGRILSRMTVQEVIRTAILSPPAAAGSLPVDSEGGLYMVLTADDVVMQDFCRAVCGFHYFTFPSIVGFTLPYAWVGNSGKQCPELCAYPFAVPAYMTGVTPLKPPNGDVGVEGMISVIGHELAELSSNPLINAWYAGNDPTEPTEIADLCEGIYGPGGGGSYMGSVLQNPAGATYNMIGVKKRKFLVQWIWNHILGYCTGPNS